VGAVNGRAAASRDSQPVPAAAERHALRTMIIDMVRQVRGSGASSALVLRRLGHADRVLMIAE